MSLSGPPVIATGGDTVQDIRGYRIHTFTTVGTSSLVVTRGGSVEVLVVAGGGGGGANNGSFTPGGGGGAGEVFYSTSYSIVPTPYVVTVGAGGSGGIQSGSVQAQQGSSSVFGNTSTNGGGRAGSGSGGQNGGNGGSGGGTARNSGGAGISIKTAGGYGNDGGSSTGTSGAGGGGALAVGGSTSSGAIGIGGSGIPLGISGSNDTYGRGGNGGSRFNNTPGTSGTANTGNGGNGAGSNGVSANGGAGGSGIVIVRYHIGMVFTGPDTSITRAIFTATPNGLTSDQASVSGLALKQGYPGYPSGTYWIKPTAGSTPGLAFVDMTTDGGGWTLAYETVTATRVTNSIVYSFNNSSNLSALSFTRVAYSMNNFNSWAFTSFDSWSSTITDHRVPSLNDPFVNQRSVNNLNVVSSNANIITGTGLSGALEIWPYNYSAGRTLSMGTYGSDSLYDINDTRSSDGGYGSFQVHDITNLRPVICWNDHSASSPDIGFGPQASGNPDWTFTNRGATSDFRVRVFVR